MPGWGRLGVLMLLMVLSERIVRSFPFSLLTVRQPLKPRCKFIRNMVGGFRNRAQPGELVPNPPRAIASDAQPCRQVVPRNRKICCAVLLRFPRIAPHNPKRIALVFSFQPRVRFPAPQPTVLPPICLPVLPTTFQNSPCVPFHPPSSPLSWFGTALPPAVVPCPAQLGKTRRQPSSTVSRCASLLA